MYYEKVIRFLDNFERVNEDTTDDLLGIKFGHIVSYQVYGIWRWTKIQKWIILINLCIATPTFVLHILIVSDWIVLEPLPMKHIIFVYYWLLLKKKELLKRVSCVIMPIFTGMLGLSLNLDLFPRSGLNPSIDVILGSTFLHLIMIKRRIKIWIVLLIIVLKPYTYMLNCFVLIFDSILFTSKKYMLSCFSSGHIKN